MNKRFVFTGIFILLALCASAQATDVPAADSLRRIGDVDTGPVTMRRAADGEGMVLEVAGFGITLGQASGGEKQKVKALPRVCGSFLSGVEMGFNFLTGADYAGYPAEAGDFLDVRGGNSFHFGIMPVGLSVALDRKRRFEFSTGLRYTVDNYRLSDNSITLGRDGGMVVPLPLDDKVDKSKFRITSLGFPLQFSFDPVRHLRVAVVGYCDFTLGANAIYKKPKEKNSLSGVNPFQFGLGGSVSYRGFGVYVRYGVTSLFKSSAGPVCHPVSFGVCVFM
ncbi:outer membrane beta-barrel protein [Alistipes sp. kh20]|uniref:outer membrane beta-barrel protein n=1 Tax=Alistipes montrealensis TaxID=2834113 RepID=UPI001BD083B1|nr:outer membrane beta-barrel protein [Alistipes montrealensis]MBS4766783.1 outer membrane beta-barrel protein [Alistipes montrealensis]